jgi:hypothetical protein
MIIKCDTVIVWYFSVSSSWLLRKLNDCDGDHWFLWKCIYFVVIESENVMEVNDCYGSHWPGLSFTQGLYFEQIWWQATRQCFMLNI